MSKVLFLVAPTSTAIFAVLALLMLRVGRRSHSQGRQRFPWIVATFYILLMLEGLQHLVARALGFPGPLEVLAGFQLTEVIQSVVAIAFGLLLYVEAVRFGRVVSESEAVIEVLMSRVPAHLSIEEIGLTARELDVAQAIGVGWVSDEDIANVLYISKDTAGTHVRNILRKAGLHRRNDILLLVTRSVQKNR